MVLTASRAIKSAINVQVDDQTRLKELDTCMSCRGVQRRPIVNEGDLGFFLLSLILICFVNVAIAVATTSKFARDFGPRPSDRRTYIRTEQLIVY